MTAARHRTRGPDRQRRLATIPRASVGDLAAILALEVRCFAEVDRFSRSTWRRLLGHCARRRTALTLVARCEGTVVGVVCGLLRRESRVLRIYSLAVDPACRGQGLGGRLIRALVEAAPRRCTTASLEVRTANEAAIALYSRLGFRQAVVLPRYYPDGGDGLRLSAACTVVRADR